MSGSRADTSAATSAVAGTSVTGSVAGVGLALERPYRVASQVALRPEGFGALAYHFGNRRLTFLTSPGLVRLVSSLDGTTPLGEVLDAKVAEGSRVAVEAALARLAEAEVLQPV